MTSTEPFLIYGADLSTIKSLALLAQKNPFGLGLELGIHRLQFILCSTSSLSLYILLTLHITLFFSYKTLRYYSRIVVFETL